MDIKLLNKETDKHQNYCLSAACGYNNTSRDCARCAIKWGYTLAKQELRAQVEALKETLLKISKCKDDCSLCRMGVELIDRGYPIKLARETLAKLEKESGE